MLTLGQTFNADRREQATDLRGLPGSYGRALAALAGTCTHCGARATTARGDGVGFCARHQRERETIRETAIQARERARRAIDMARRGK